MKLYAENLREGQKNQNIFRTKGVIMDLIIEELWKTF